MRTKHFLKEFLFYISNREKEQDVNIIDTHYVMVATYQKNYNTNTCHLL